MAIYKSVFLKCKHRVQLMNFTLLCISLLQVQLHLQLLLLAYSDQLISSVNHLKCQKENVKANLLYHHWYIIYEHYQHRSPHNQVTHSNQKCSVMLARDRTSRVVGRYSTNHLPNWKRWKPHYNITYIAVGEDIVLITHSGPHTTRSPSQLEELEAALQHHLYSSKQCIHVGWAAVIWLVRERTSERRA
jgi:hypothetical protein